MSALQDPEDVQAEQEGPSSSSPQSVTSEQTTDVLTSLLIGMTKSEVQDLRASVHSEEAFAERVSAVLGEAVEIADTDPRLMSSLGTVTERSVLEIARRQPDKLGDAIAPAMGPAIRGMVALALADLNERVESIIQQSFSIQGVKWRIESVRTGTPLSELVLRDTLTYRVEHALLIHRSSGTLLNHAMQPEYEGKDPAVVAAMLTAVKQFLEDAFERSGHRDDQEELSHQFSAGDSSIVIKAAGELALAVVVRGTQTARLEQIISTSLQSLLEAYGRQALSFDGNIERYSGALSLLENCLRTEQAKVTSSPGVTKAGVVQKLRRHAPVIVLCLAVVGWWGYQFYAEQKNWQAFTEALKSQSGIAITGAVKTDGQTATISGLRDPDASEVALLAEQFGYTEVTWEFQRYLSLEPSVTLARAHRILLPPSSINLRFGDGTLRITGRASDEWLGSIEHLRVPGVVAYDVSQVLPLATL